MAGVASSGSPFEFEKTPVRKIEPVAIAMSLLKLRWEKKWENYYLDGRARLRLNIARTINIAKTLFERCLKSLAKTRSYKPRPMAKKRLKAFSDVSPQAVDGFDHERIQLFAPSVKKLGFAAARRPDRQERPGRHRQCATFCSGAFTLLFQLHAELMGPAVDYICTHFNRSVGIDPAIDIY